MSKKIAFDHNTLIFKPLIFDQPYWSSAAEEEVQCCWSKIRGLKINVWWSETELFNVINQHRWTFMLKTFLEQYRNSIN